MIAYNQSGLVINWTNAPVGTTLANVIVGERINLEATWVGHNPPANNATVTWRIDSAGAPIQGFYTQNNQNGDLVSGGYNSTSGTPIAWGSQSGANEFSFVWTAGSFKGSVYHTTATLSTGQSATGGMTVYRPLTDIAVQVALMLTILCHR